LCDLLIEWRVELTESPPPVKARKLNKFVAIGLGLVATVICALLAVFVLLPVGLLGLGIIMSGASSMQPDFPIEEGPTLTPKPTFTPYPATVIIPIGGDVPVSHLVVQEPTGQPDPVPTTPVYEEQFAALDATLADDPANVEALIARARLFYNSYQTQAGLDDISKAIELAPDNIQALIIRSWLYRQSGDLDAAWDDVNKALELDPNSPAAYTERSNLYKEDDDIRKAIADLEHALDLDPNFSYALNNSGIIYLENGDRASAFDFFARSAEADPNNSAPHTNLGNIYLEEGRLQDALDEYALAIAISGGSTYEFSARGDLYHLYLQDYQAAIANYTRALQFNPNQPTLLLWRAIAYRHAGEYELALDDLESSRQLDPTSPYVIVERGKTFNAMEEYELALEDFTWVIDNYHNFDSAYYGRGIAYQGLGDLNASFADFSKFDEITPNYLPAEYQLARLGFIMDRPLNEVKNHCHFVSTATGGGGSRRYILDATEAYMQQHPDDRWPYYLLMYYNYENNDGEQALEYARGFIEVDTEHDQFTDAILQNIEDLMAILEQQP
jgi:tetratricopeptide (TPR) repeat protein